MADFKIKPAAGTGNKLILESEDGTDVLTTSDSGVTLASATLTSPTLNSPTLNSPTLVTPALGTVATGNLSNSAIVYPTGHVIQVVSSGAIEQAYQDNSSSYKLVTSHTLPITPSLESSKVLVTICFSARSYGTVVTHYTIYRGTTQNLGPANGLATFHDDNASSDNEQHTTLTFLDSPNTDSAVTYGLYGKCPVTGECRVNAKGSASVITLMEIAG